MKKIQSAKAMKVLKVVHLVCAIAWVGSAIAMKMPRACIGWQKFWKPST